MLAQLLLDPFCSSCWTAAQSQEHGSLHVVLSEMSYQDTLAYVRHVTSLCACFEVDFLCEAGKIKEERIDGFILFCVVDSLAFGRRR